MNSKNSDSKENERKAENKADNGNHQPDGGSDYGRAANVNEGWQAGATEYDVNYREQGFSSSSQSTTSMGVEKVAHASDVPNSDELIYEEVHMLFEHQPDIDFSNVELTVKNGEVFLEGTVREPLSNRQLDEAIAMVAGVQHLHNRLRIVEDSAPVESSAEAQKKRDFPTSS